jgi:hypothetical protein
MWKKIYDLSEDDFEDRNLFDTFDYKKQCCKLEHYFQIHKKTGALGVHKPVEFDNFTFEEFLNKIKNYNKIWFFRGCCIPLDMLHDDVEELLLPTDYNLKIEKYPSKLKKLVLFCDIPVDNLPSSIEKLYVTGSFNSDLNNLPNTIKKLKINGFYKKIIETLPNSLECLEINLIEMFRTNYGVSKELNQILYDFPSQLKKLIITGMDFKELPTIPPSVKILNLGSNFNHSIEGILPEGLEELHLGYNFNYPLGDESKSFLPSSLKKLYIGVNDCMLSSFSHKIHSFPDGLEELVIYAIKEYKHQLPELPVGLKTFKFVVTHRTEFLDEIHPFEVPNYNEINENIKNNKKKEFIFNFENLPQQLEIIQIFCNDFIIRKIPESCKDLSIFWNNYLDNLVLNNVIEYISIENNTYTAIPSAVIEKFYSNMILPPTLNFLRIPFFDGRIIKTNDNLETLIVGPTYLCEIKSVICNLSDNITDLSLEANIEYIDKLPKNLKNLSVSYLNTHLFEQILNSLPKNEKDKINYKVIGGLERQYAYHNNYEF